MIHACEVHASFLWLPANFMPRSLRRPGDGTGTLSQHGWYCRESWSASSLWSDAPQCEIHMYSHACGNCSVKFEVLSLAPISHRRRTRLFFVSNTFRVNSELSGFIKIGLPYQLNSSLLGVLAGMELGREITRELFVRLWKSLDGNFINAEFL